MASMSTKEAKRRGLMPRSNGSTGVSTMYGDNLMLNLTGRDPEPIMFGGLGRINMFGNDTDAKMGGGENLRTRGLYGLGSISNSPQGLLNAIMLGGAVMALTGNASFRNKDLKQVAMYGAGGYVLYKALNN